MGSLKTRMIVFVLAILTVVSALLCGVAYVKTREALLASINQQIEQAAAAKMSFVTEWVASRCHRCLDAGALRQRGIEAGSRPGQGSGRAGRHVHRPTGQDDDAVLASNAGAAGLRSDRSAVVRRRRGVAECDCLAALHRRVDQTTDHHLRQGAARRDGGQTGSGRRG